MKNNLFIRVDSSSEIGIGHMMRCLTLAQELKNNFDKIIFLTQKDSGDFIGTIMKNKFEVIFIPTTNNDPDIIKNKLESFLPEYEPQDYHSTTPENFLSEGHLTIESSTIKGVA